MIEIELLRDKEKRIVGFSASGHALYKKKGEDIVCAGVSAIIQTAILGLSEYLNLRLDIAKGDGNIRVGILSKLEEASSILETMRLGLYEIAKKYPSHIKIKED